MNLERRARVAMAAIAAVVPLVSAFGWNVHRNVQARERLARACAHLDRATAEQWVALGPIVQRLCEEEAPVVESAFRGLGAEACPALTAELESPARWNWGRTWAPAPMGEEELARFRAAMARAEENCPSVFADMFRELGRTDAPDPAAVQEACREMMGGFDARAAAEVEGRTAEPVAVWDWPEDLERLAAAVEGLGEAGPSPAR